MKSRLTLVAFAVAVGVPLAVSASEALGPPPRVVPDVTLGPVPIPPVLDGQVVSGTAFVGYRGTDGQTTGAVVTASPWWKSFLRLGAEVTPRSKDGGDVRLLWGLGFESWRDRTFFLHVHDWGPVRPDESFTLRHAEASLGYKLPRPCGGPFCLAPTAFATLPFDGGPYVGARATVMLWSWFAAGGFGWTIPGALEGSATPPAWRVSFALGRWDWRPGGLFLTYRDDMGLDRLRTWSTDERQGNGVVAAGVNWAY